MSKMISAGVMMLAGVLALSPAIAAPKMMKVPLTGASEVPPVQTPGKGSAELSYDPDTRKLSWTVEFSDLSSPATMAHFHGPAAPGKNGPPVLWIVEKGEKPVSPIKGEAVLTPEQAKAFSDGEWYLNVHTTNNMSGEIRGYVPSEK